MLSIIVQLLALRGVGGKWTRPSTTAACGGAYVAASSVGHWRGKELEERGHGGGRCKEEGDAEEAPDEPQQRGHRGGRCKEKEEEEAGKGAGPGKPQDGGVYVRGQGTPARRKNEVVAQADFQLHRILLGVVYPCCGMRAASGALQFYCCSPSGRLCTLSYVVVLYLWKSTVACLQGRGPPADKAQDNSSMC